MTKVEPYRLDPIFERAVMLSLVKRSKFYGVIGHALDPEALGSKTHTLLLKAVRAVAKELGHAPSHESIILQRVRRWVGDGLITQEDLNDVVDFFLDAPSAIPTEAEVVAELTPVLRRRMQAEAVRSAMAEYAQKGDFDQIQKLLNKARTLGKLDTSVGLRLGAGAFQEIERLRTIDRLPLGITELDIALDGGLPRGCQGIYVAGTGGGKSMMLTHIASQAVRRGYFVVVATLELNRATWMARVLANLTGEPINKIMNADLATTKKKIDEMYPVFGTFIVMDFAAKLTTMKDLCAWYDSCAEEEGHAPHLFVVDYADKCSSHLKDDAGNDYQGQGTVYETMRLFCHERGIWGWTGSQPKRGAGKDKFKKIDIDDLADSQNKARVADLVISGVLAQNGEELDYSVGKFRYGKANFSVGPLPHQWECGRMVCLSDEY